MKSVISAEPNRVTWSNLANHPKPRISLVEDALKLAQRGTTNPAGSFHKLNFWRHHNPPPWLWGVFWVTFSKQDDDNSSHLYGLYRIIFTGYLKTHFLRSPNWKQTSSLIWVCQWSIIEGEGKMNSWRLSQVRGWDLIVNFPDALHAVSWPFLIALSQVPPSVKDKSRENSAWDSV